MIIISASFTASHCLRLASYNKAVSGLGHVNLIRAALPHLRANRPKWGRIITVTSMSAPLPPSAPFELTWQL